MECMFFNFINFILLNMLLKTFVSTNINYSLEKYKLLKKACCKLQELIDVNHFLVLIYGYNIILTSLQELL